MIKKICIWFFGVALAVFLPFAAHAEQITTPLTVGTSSPAVGSTTSISGNCGSTGANSSVSFSLNQNGTVTALPSGSNLTTNTSGAFTGNITFPSGYASGPATLIVTCNGSGNTFQPYNLTFAASSGSTTSNGSFTLGGANPNAGGSYAVSGACGNPSGTSTVNLSLVSNGTTTPLGTVSLTPTGTFTNSVLIPSSVSAGTATLLATCSNGTTFSSPITVNSAAVTSFGANASPMVGSNDTISGTCVGNGGTVLNTSGPVTFSLLSNGMTTPLVASNTSLDTSGRFNATVSYPAGVSSGANTLVVTCPGGGSYATPITLSATASSATPATTGSGGLAFPTDSAAMGGVAGSTSTTTTPTGTSVTPSGGVSAGGGGANSEGAYSTSALLLLLGLGAAYVSRRLVG